MWVTRIKLVKLASSDFIPFTCKLSLCWGRSSHRVKEMCTPTPPPEIKPSLFLLLKFVSFTSQLRCSLVVHPPLRNSLDPPCYVPLTTKIPLRLFSLKRSKAEVSAVPARGRYFRNFWVGMCRWDPGTLRLYQS